MIMGAGCLSSSKLTQPCLRQGTVRYSGQGGWHESARTLKLSLLLLFTAAQASTGQHLDYSALQCTAVHYSALQSTTVSVVTDPSGLQPASHQVDSHKHGTNFAPTYFKRILEVFLLARLFIITIFVLSSCSIHTKLCTIFITALNYMG